MATDFHRPAWWHDLLRRAPTTLVFLVFVLPVRPLIASADAEEDLEKDTLSYQ
ncbi:MAG TPA: hypothetical protein VNO55_19440 [Polyangia bacterium]|nr:hypothetical protein [Polyangia bacterium]